MFASVTKLKKILFVISILCLFSTKSLAASNYFGGSSGGGGITGLVIGTTTATSGTSGYCLTGVSGILQNQACGITGLAVGTTTVTSGTSGYCLTNVSGVLQNQTCGGGANTALSNLSGVAINSTLLPDNDETYSIGDATHRWLSGYFTSLKLHSNTGTISLSTQSSSSTYAFTLPTDGGTSGYVLQTNGSGTTSWVAQSGGGFTSRASAYFNNGGTPLSISASAWTLVPFDALTPSFGSTSEFDITTNKGRFTSTSGGIYQVNATIANGSNGASTIHELSLYKNGSAITYGPGSLNLSANTFLVSISTTVQLNAGEYIEIFDFNPDTTATIINGSSLTNVQITQIQ